VLGRRSIVALPYRHPSMDGPSEVSYDFRRDLDQVAAMVGLHTSVSVHVDADRRPVRVVCGDHRRYYPEAVAFSLPAYRGGAAVPASRAAASPSGCTSPVGRRSTCRPRSRG